MTFHHFHEHIMTSHLENDWLRHVFSIIEFRKNTADSTELFKHKPSAKYVYNYKLIRSLNCKDRTDCIESAHEIQTFVTLKLMG